MFKAFISVALLSATVLAQTSVNKETAVSANTVSKAIEIADTNNALRFFVECPGKPLEVLNAAPELAEAFRSNRITLLLKAIDQKLNASLQVAQMLEKHKVSELVKTFTLDAKGSLTADPEFMKDYRKLLATPAGNLRKSLEWADCLRKANLKGLALDETDKKVIFLMTGSSKLDIESSLRHWNSEVPPGAQEVLAPFWKRLNEESQLALYNAENIAFIKRNMFDFFGQK